MLRKWFIAAMIMYSPAASPPGCHGNMINSVILYTNINGGAQLINIH